MDTSNPPIKPILMILAISFGGYFASYLMTVLLTRMLGSASYSAYVSTISMISMISMLALCLLLGVLTIICNIFNPVSTGVFALFSPKISNAVATLNSAKVRRLLILSILASFVPSIIGFLVILFYGKSCLLYP